MGDFVHGAGGSSSIWFKSGCKKQYNVVVLRGHGESKTTLKTAFKQKYTFSALANDIHEVLDFLAIRRKSHFRYINGDNLIGVQRCIRKGEHDSGEIS
jgi:pimeloyl-ACP methyl ester carboxylesterase